MICTVHAVCGVFSQLLSRYRCRGNAIPSSLFRIFHTTVLLVLVYMSATRGEF